MSRVYILDTQILLWWLVNDKRLNDKVIDVIESGNNLIYSSVASLWEIAIKKQIGKLQLRVPFEELVDNIPFPLLSIQKDHILNLVKLPEHHKDPFDRILLAQALSLEATLVTSDKKLQKYKVPLWLV